MARAKVAVLKTTPERVVEDYLRLAELAGLAEALDRSAPTIIKDNISWHFPFPGANTTPWQLEGSVLALQAGGFTDLAVVQNDTVVTNAFKGERLNRFTGIFEKYSLPVLYNFRKSDITWEVYRPRGRMLVLDEIYPDGIRIPKEFHGRNVVHLPTIKTHIYTAVTGAMKNAFGGLLNRRRHYTHSRIHQTLVDLLRIQKEIHSGIFAFTDGTTCGNGPGPRTMQPVDVGLILASSDCTALDAVSSRLIGFNPLEIGYIRIAHEEGLGVGDPREIELVGDDVSGLDLHFSVGDNLASRVGDVFWFSPLKVLEKLMFHTPLVYLFVLGSALYHDWLWYPTRGRKIVKQWQGTRWGELFEKY
ncbi:MAG TPA: DUF362 domain-containing protein [Candidatus Glassbacteria bacterium]|nr:DUF362 domain-containing protein [Candidatus Glassbacteria bacterium]